MTARITRQVHVWALVVLSGAVSISTAQAPGAYNGAQTFLPISGTSTPIGIAVDGMGNVFASDAACHCIWKIPATGATQTKISLGTGSYPFGIAVDAQGDLFVADPANGRVVELPWMQAGWGAQSNVPLGATAACPLHIALDSGGDLFVLNALPSGLGYQSQDSTLFPTSSCPSAYKSQSAPVGLFEVPSSGAGWGAVIPFGNAWGTGLAIDSRNDLYLAEPGSSSNTALTGGIYMAPLTGTGNPSFSAVSVDPLYSPYAIAVDTSGNLFSTWHWGSTFTYGALEELPWTGNAFGAPVTPYSNPSGQQIGAVAVDAAGNLYVGNNFSTNAANAVTELQFNALNFYTQPVGTPSSAVAMNFTVNGTTSQTVTIGSVAITSSGTPGQDFVDAGGSTCIATTYTATTNCAINLKFNPRAPGVRRGGVAVFDSSGNAMGSWRLYGYGVGPESVLTGTPMIQSQSTQNMYNAVRVVTDAAGNAFVASYASNPKTPFSGSVIEYPRSGSGFGTPFPVPGVVGVSSLNELAFDGAGNLFVLSLEDPKNDGNSGALKVSPKNASGYDQPVTIVPGLNYPMGLLVDPQENIFVALNSDGTIIEFTPTPAGVLGAPVTVASGLTYPNAIARDAMGNLYVTLFCSDAYCDSNTGSLIELPLTPSGYAAPVTLASGLNYPAGAAVEANGNLLVASSGDGGPDGAILEFQYTGSGYKGPVTLAGGLTNSQGVTVDTWGNIIFPDPGQQRLDMLPRGGSPGLSFATTVRGTTSSDSPQTVTVENIGNQPLIFSGLSYPLDFPEAGGHSTDCTSSKRLSPVQTCTLTVDFQPVTAISSGSSLALSESLQLTTNTLNNRGTVQRLSLAGTETPGKIAPTLTLAVSNTRPVAKVPITLTATATGFGGTPTGAVTFFDGSTQMGSPVLLSSSGVATLTIAPPASGSLTASYAGDANFNPATSNAVTVTLTKLRATVTLSNLNQTYTGSPITATATTNPAGLTVNITYNGSASPPVHAGSYAVVATINDNFYQGSATGTLVIAKANPESNIVWLPLAPITYGTPLSSTQLDAYATLPGTFVYTPPAGTVLSAGTHTLRTLFTPTDTTDWTTAPATVYLTVNPAVLTVRAADISVPYGWRIPPLTYSLTGFVNGDTRSVLSGAPSETTTAMQGSPRGTYPITITQGTLSAANYTFTLVNGTLTIY
jgi:streptogramin lyase